VVAAHKRHARGCGPTQGLGAKGTRAERTLNMPSMVVTLEVSKLSGRLKADADCRVKGRACDAGGRGALEPGGGRAWGACVVAAHKRHARGCGPTQGLGAKGTRGAHGEHVAHGRDAGGVEAQWLVEGRRALPSRREGMRCGGRGASREAGGPVVWWRHTRGMHGDGPTQGLGAKGTRGAHGEHGAHGRDAGGVEAQRLVEGRRALPSRREGMRCGGRGTSREAGGPGVWWRHTRGMHGDRPDSRLGGHEGTRGERTENMRIMVVTLEVSKLSGWLKAAAACRVEGRACDAEWGEVRARRREGPGWWRHTRGMHGDRPDSRLGGHKGTRGAHAEHVNHVRDAGGVEAQRLVEGRRRLPS